MKAFEGRTGNAVRIALSTRGIFQWDRRDQDPSPRGLRAAGLDLSRFRPDGEVRGYEIALDPREREVVPAPSWN
jgi:hypothetical protein